MMQKAQMPIHSSVSNITFEHLRMAITQKAPPHVTEISAFSSAQRQQDRQLTGILLFCFLPESCLEG